MTVHDYAGADGPRNLAHPVVLVTGASGVVGQAVLDALSDVLPVCLVHRHGVDRPGVSSVHGDITAPHLGLGASGYAKLARQVDAVIHCAAVTEFRQDDGTLERTNIAGTEAMAAFAARAEVPLYHLSTAFINAQPIGAWGHTATRYAASKREAEQVVRASGAKAVIVRPSVVIGAADSGAVSAFQGLYLVAGAILDGLVPMIPFDGAWPIDFVPCDLVGQTVAALVRQRRSAGEVWITAGSDALALREAVGRCVAAGRAWGIDVADPRFVTPEMFDRLVAPVFLEALPRRMRFAVTRLLEFFASYLGVESPLPGSRDVLAELGVAPAPDPRQTLDRSLAYWAQHTGRLVGHEAAA
jgi:nucleoside-diphosphate-sugar epimerase